MTDPECKRCRNIMRIRDGCEPTDYCDECAHDLLDYCRKRARKAERKLAQYKPVSVKVG